MGNELPGDAGVPPDRHRLHRRGQQQRFVRVGERHPAVADSAGGALDDHCRRPAPATLLARHAKLEHAAQALVHAQHVSAFRVGPDPSASVPGQIDADAVAFPLDGWVFVAPQPILDDVRFSASFAIAPEPVEHEVVAPRGEEDGEGFFRERLRVGALGLVFRLRRPAIGFQKSSPHDRLWRHGVGPFRPLDPHLVQEASGKTDVAKAPRHRPHADSNVRQHVQRLRIEVFDGGLDALHNRLHVGVAGTLRGDRCCARKVGSQHERPQDSPAHPETIATALPSRNMARLLEGKRVAQEEVAC